MGQRFKSNKLIPNLSHYFLQLRHQANSSSGWKSCPHCHNNVTYSLGTTRMNWIAHLWLDETVSSYTHLSAKAWTSFSFDLNFITSSQYGIVAQFPNQTHTWKHWLLAHSVTTFQLHWKFTCMLWLIINLAITRLWPTGILDCHVDTHHKSNFNQILCSFVEAQIANTRCV